MFDKKTKLSPAEFLAQLRQRKPSGGANGSGNNGTSHDSQGSDIHEMDSGVGTAIVEPTPQVPTGKDRLPKETPIQGKTDKGSAPADVDDLPAGDAQLSELFNRVNRLLGEQYDPEKGFRPRVPATLGETRLTFEEVERLILKFLLAKGSATGRELCLQIRLPFQIVDPILKQLKQDQLVMFKGAAAMGDYDYAITENGRERARRYSDECSYIGPAPVSLRDYLEAMALQSIAKQKATEVDLRKAFEDLVLTDDQIDSLGPAVNSGRGMFLFGAPGNGKTSIAERITQCFGSTIWIPRVLGIDGEIIRLYDPGVHTEIEEPDTGGLFDLSGVDQRWVQIVRPTVIAGGELRMEELEVTQNPVTRICEAPLQLRSNCGTLVIDDFGRQTMPVDMLLNRWIVPLEKRFDFLNLPSGKKIQVPFDQLIIFSTNLEPKDLVDDAFLRRIPYKIEVPDPSEEIFINICKAVAPSLGFDFDADSIDYLLEKHFRHGKRRLRCCHPRDLILQVKNFCTFKGKEKKLSPEAFDFAVRNYFSVM